jgi:SDR family mycofactocin-dependent oxidoreductase
MSPASAPGSLVDRVVLITGGARGQGRSHAVACGRAGAAVVICDAPEPMASVSYPLGTVEDMARTIELVEATGAPCVAMTTDVRSSEAVDAAVAATLERFGRLDCLVANAGIAGYQQLADVTDLEWHEMIATNLTGVFNSVRAVVPQMKAQRYGRIVATASMGGRSGIPNLGHYNASKWGVIGLIKTLALEVARDGITANVVAPCTVRTPMVENRETFELFSPESDEMQEILERFRRVNPIPEPWLEAEDVTREVMHLLTDPGNVSGTVLEVALGLSARMH